MNIDTLKSSGSANAYYDSLPPSRLRINKPVIRTPAITDMTIVLDLDETLVRSEEGDEAKMLIKYLVDPKFYNRRQDMYKIVVDTGRSKSLMYGIKRPYLDLFLDFVFYYFRNVIVWSAGHYDYVHKICNIIFNDHYRPDAIYTNDDCVMEKRVLTKPLRKIYNTEKDINEKNTIILDDRETVFSGPNPRNGILIPAYDPYLSEPINSNVDNRLLEFMRWLMLPRVRNTSDVRYLDKNFIFS